MEGVRTHPRDIRERTFAYALRAAKLCQSLARVKDGAGWVIGRRHLRAATSIGANIKDVSPVRSRADFIHELTLAQKEARESHHS